MFSSSSSSQYSLYGHDSRYGRSSATSGSAQGGHYSSGSTWPSVGGIHDPFGQTRSTYQQGYILSASQSGNAPSTSPRHDELPVIQTKAKMNSSLVRAHTTEFGRDPMFENTRRMHAPDQDAPPIASVNDMVNTTYPDSRNRTFEKSFFASPSRPPVPQPASDPLYVIVFGYPADKYSVTASYFTQLGASSGAEPVPDLLNAFKIGYTHPADALRAVRKNGEVLAGQWMVGAKWENQAKAEGVLGSSLVVSLSPPGEGMAVDEPPSSIARTPSAGGSRSPVGGASPGGDYTPVRLAPAASAFRKTGTPATPAAANAGPGPTPASTPTSGKGVLGQVSDMIFGW